MAMTGWFTVALVCLLALALGLWVVSRIFPDGTPGDDVAGRLDVGDPPLPDRAP